MAVPPVFLSPSSRTRPPIQDPYEFPSFPTAKISAFGRTLSESIGGALQMEEQQPSSTSSSPRSPRFQVRAPPSPEQVFVPGMGDEPVLCPYCDKPLPPALFDQHVAAEGQRAKAASTPRASTRTPPPESATNNDETPKGKTGADPAVSPSRSATQFAESEGPMTTESLRDSVDKADDADTTAGRAAISAADLRRWSSLAGIDIAPPALALTPQSAPAAPRATTEPATKAFPLLPPPPGTAKAAGNAGRFGFFSRKSSSAMGDDDSDSDSGHMSGYAKLGAPDASDDEDDGYESDKPFSKKALAKAEEKKETEPEKPVDPPSQVKPTHMPVPVIKSAASSGDAELRALLKEVLGRVQALSTSHTDLLQSHTALVTTLKIARSNLVMAEANTEMLEEELRRAKAAPAIARVGTPNSVARSSADTGRVSSEQGHRRPLSVSVPPPGSIPAGPSSGRGSSGGWFNTKKKSMSGALPSPTIDGARGSNESQRSPVLSSHDAVEVKRLKEKLEAQAGELEVLKKGKKEIEAELEGLSQALFEEANKMVAYERRLRAEVEENLREVSDEREALRETIKVLGGKPVPEEAKEDYTPQKKEGEEQVRRQRRMTLDSHYAALRRTIHHVADGPSPEGTLGDVSAAGEGESALDSSGDGTEDDEDEDGQSPTATYLDASEDVEDKPRGADVMTMPPVPKSSLDAEPNPWG